MSEIMDDFDAGHASGWDAGKKFTQQKVIELMDEVIFEYKMQKLKMHAPSAQIAQAKLNAAEFMKSWVTNGGHTDENGNRVCLPW